MNEIYSSLISGAIGIVTGVAGFYIGNRFLEKKRESLASLRDQLKYFYAPLEILMKMNNQSFNRYFDEKTTEHDREYIECHIWYPNNVEMKQIIMDHSHLLNTMPPILMILMEHINVWLSEYELIYEKKEKDPPVFAEPKGYRYPREAANFVYEETEKLRKKLNK